jgi:transcriptional regulator of NAD metabolism
MEQKTETMDGITFLVDENNERKFVQIDLEKFDAEYIEDLLDGLMAEAVKDEESVSLEDAIEELKAAGKLDE